MGERNRRRRPAGGHLRERDRRREQEAGPRASEGGRPPGSGEAGRPRADGYEKACTEVLAAVATVAIRPEQTGYQAQRLTEPTVLWSTRDLDRALDAALLRLLEALWNIAWQPRDLAAVCRRRLPSQQLLVDLLAVDTSRRARATIDRRWWSQLDELDAVLLPVEHSTLAETTRRRQGIGVTAALTEALELAAVLGSLPSLQVLLPPPGSAGVRPFDPVWPADGAQAKALARVRGLLAKAESTEFPEEAEALSAKAQELMARHSLEQLLAADTAAPDDGPPGRRLWLDPPYVSAKAVLVHVVARANRCTCVQLLALDMVYVIGAERDVDAVELMVTSLLVQATRAMLEQSSAVAGARSRSRGYRKSFLVAYAQRIGERLAAATEQAERSAQAATGRDLRPVLLSQLQRVEAATRELFPNTRTTSISAPDRFGYAAGRAAADAARLPQPDAVAG